MATHGAQHLRALYAVFVRPALLASTGFSRPTQLARFPASRLLSTTAPRQAISRRPPPKTAAKAVEPKQFRDNDIPAKRVRVVDESGQIGEPEAKSDVLRNLDPKTHRLVCVSKPPRYIAPGNPDYNELAQNYDYVVDQYTKARSRPGNQGKDGDDDAEVQIQNIRNVPAILVMPGRFIRMPSGETWVPVCKIENKAEVAAKLREQEATRKEQKKLAPEGVKSIELNWAIDPNDLGHRLQKVEEFLQARRKVEIIIAPKRRGRKATTEECEALLRRIRETVSNVEGAKESRPMQGKPGQVANIMLEGKRN